MDVILKHFFDNFENVERNSLHARYKRRAMVEYFNTLIVGCTLGENRNEQKIVREAIINILRYHQKSKNDNGNVCIMGKYHNVLYVALKLCYDWQLKDTETVAAVLDEIYSCERTFERLLVGALFGTRAPHFIAGWKSDFASQEENVRAMVFFLDHATNANLEYDQNTRFIDVPIESCGKATCLKIIAQLGLPDLLHIFLRFGAVITNEDPDESIAMILLNKLTEYSNKGYPYNYVSCLQLLLRVLTRVHVGAVNYLESDGKSECLQFKYLPLVRDCILPLNRCGFQPAELKHLCRCKIRHQLWLNYQLPCGILTLPVPELLRRYIDLMED